MRRRLRRISRTETGSDARLQPAARRRAADRSSRFSFEALESRLLLTTEIEPNDALGTATSFAASSDTLDGTISTASDLDFFKANYNQGQTLTVRPGGVNIPNGNGANDPGALHYAPAVRVLDSASNVLAISTDGHPISVVIPADGTYYVRVSSDSAYGRFAEAYRNIVSVSEFSGTTESEPNGTTATATAFTLTNNVANFRGSLSTASDKDVFSFAGTVGQVVAFKLGNVPAKNPALRLRRPDDTVVAMNLSGDGLHAQLPSTGTYTVELASDNSAGTVTGGYVGEVIIAASAVLEFEPADQFTNAPVWTVGNDITLAAGTLASTSDVDVFAVDFSAMNMYEFRLRGLPDNGATSGPDDGLSTQNRVLTLYNEYGQILEYSTNGVVGTREPNFGAYLRPEWIGRHYISVRANSGVGLGGYVLTGEITETSNAQRDVPLFYQDFTNSVNHLANFGCAPVAPFTRPDTVNLLIGQFEAQYDTYDVDITTTYPGSGVEAVGMGMRDFNCTGTGAGLGSGSYGVRRSSGDAVTDNTGSGWADLLDVRGAAGLMRHEVGHGTGLPHGRQPLDYMGYDNQGVVNSVGSYFPFPSTDSRVPEVEMMNKRDYLDWVLQAGRVAGEAEPNDATGTAQNLDPYFGEMAFDMQQKGGFAAGSHPKFLTTGFFNADANLDIITANDSSAGLNVLLGNGDGTFGPASNIPAASDAFQTERVAVGDFNGDSKTDLAITNFFGNDLSIRLGNGDGTFQGATNFGAGSGPQSIAVAELNNDNKLDLIVANNNSRVNVLLGNGNGTFQAAVAYAANFCPISVAAADVNGDSKIDVVTANQCTNDVSVLLGNGNGTLQTAVNYNAGPNPYSIVVGDFDNDSKKDLVVANANAFNTADDTVSLLRGDGNGTFQTAVNYAVEGDPYSLAAGDLNADGRSDLVASSYESNGFIQVLRGNADGTLAAPIRFATGTYPAGVAVGQFDGAGTPLDIVAANYWTGNVGDVGVLLGRSNDPRNDRVTVVGSIGIASDVDLVKFTAAPGETFAFDIDSAEFQMPLDAQLTILDSLGGTVTQSQGGRDWDSGLDSVDPMLMQTFGTGGTYYVRVAGEHGSVGNYRLKVTPVRAFDTSGPRVIASWPDGGTSTPSTRQLIFWLNDQLDPATLTGANIVVQGNTNGVRSGTAAFDPLQTTLIWVADAALPADTYTVTLNGGASGIKDLRGNQLDGETDGTLSWPEVSGNGVAGGNFTSTFTISGADSTAASNFLTHYRAHPYNRGDFTLRFDDELNVASINSGALTLRGAGPDWKFSTSDDTFTPVDVWYDQVSATDTFPIVEVYTRGYPDSDLYRLEGSVLDAAGNTVNLSQVYTGANTTLAGDFNRTTDATFAVDVPAGSASYDISITLAGPTVNDNFVRTNYETSSDFTYVRASETAMLTRRVTISDGQLTFRLQDWGGFSPSVGVAVLDVVKVSGAPFERHFDFGTAASPVGVGYTKVTETTTYSGAQGFGWTAGSVTSGNVPDTMLCGGQSIGCTPVTPITFGPSVADINVQPGSVLTSVPSALEVTFNGNVNPATLTSSSFVVRYSPDPDFFDNNDTQLPGIIRWSSTLHRASFEPTNALVNGYYLIELDGDPGGITNPAGSLLNGEYLDSAIAGNTQTAIWKDAPSGDAFAGGDYRAYFVFDAVRIWDGGGSTENWSEAANWVGDVAPIAGNSVVFNGTSIKNSTVDAGFAGTIGRLSIDAAYTGTITLGRSLNTGSLAGTGSSSLNLAGNTLTTGADGTYSTFGNSISGAGGLTKTGSGSFYLGGNNSYDGPTTISGGSLLVSSNNALGTVAGSTTVAAGGSARLVFERGVNYSTAEPVTINGSGLNGVGSLVSTGNTSFAGPITLGSASAVGTYPAGATFTLSGDIATAANFLTVKGTGDTIVSGNVGGTGGVTKEGTGTLTLSHANNYSGATTVSAGTVLVSGSTASSASAVATGATLGGTGTIGATTVSGGTVSPGMVGGVGILAGSTANFSAGGTLRVQIQGFATVGTQYDRLDLSGALTMGGTSKITLDLAGLSTAGTAVGVARYGSRSGAFATFELLNNPSNYTPCFAYGATSLDVTLQMGACFQWVTASPGTPEVSITTVLPRVGRIGVADAQRVTVASMDSGVDYTHPSLARSIRINQGEIPVAVRRLLRDYDTDGRITMDDLNRRGNQGAGRITDRNGNGRIDGGDILAAWSDGLDDDGNGYVDDLIGWDFVNNDNDPFDDNGHGTHGAGLIVQVAANADILPLKFLDSNAVGSLSDAVRALDYSLSQGASISSNGWAASVFSPEWSDEIAKAGRAGHLLITAAGNGDPELLNILDRLQHDNMMVVSANDAEGRLAAFSNWGAGIVDLAAPGVGVVSAMPGGRTSAQSGTSVATAVVAGIAARLRGSEIEPTAANIIDAILAASTPKPATKLGVLRLPTAKQLAAAAAAAKKGPPVVSAPSTPVIIHPSPPQDTTAAVVDRGSSVPSSTTELDSDTLSPVANEHVRHMMDIFQRRFAFLPGGS
jgi:autotransporter-associated beta strand protein